MVFIFSKKNGRLLGNKNLKAGSHDADNTVRAQILTRKINREYYDLISSFYKLTGCGGLLNTSFNLHGFPIFLKSSLVLRPVAANPIHDRL